jgi:type IV secretion system protein VirB5
MLDSVADITSTRSVKRQFIERAGVPVILNQWLAAGLLACLVVIAALSWSVVTLSKEAANLKPLVVRIDEVGRAEAVAYDVATTVPNLPEVWRFHLSQFVVKHYSRRRATIASDFSSSLFFLDGQLGDQILGVGGANGPVEAFVKDPSADEIDVKVKNVTFTNLTTPPYQAAVDYVALHYAPNTATAHKTETFTASLTFTKLDTVPNAYIRVNPLGLQITQLRIDQGFD